MARPVIGLIVSAALSASALALDCPQMPRQAQQDWESEVKVAVGKVGAASGTELTARTQRATTELLGKLPHADKVYLEQMMFASYCSAVRDNATLTETEREGRVKAYGVQLRLTLGAATPEPRPPPTDPRDAARRALERIPVDYSVAAFLKSIREGRADVVDLFLQAGIDPNSEDDKGTMALAYAAAQGKVKIVEALLRAKASLTGQAVSFAAQYGQSDVLRLLLQRGVEASMLDNAFLAAAGAARLETLQLLGSRIGDRRRLSSRALPDAAWHTNDESGALAVIRELLAMGADVDAQNDGGWSALARAADAGHATVVQALLAAHADADTVCACRGFNDGNYSPLAMAALRGHIDVATRLVRAGAKVNTRTTNGTSPLMLVASNSGSPPLLLLLLDAGADPNARDGRGDTALVHGVHRAEVVRTLLEHGADVNARNDDGATALMTAAANDYVEIADVLLAAGANVQQRSSLGRTALMIAVRNGSLASVRLLIAHGGHANDRDADGKTLLMHAHELDSDDAQTIIALLTQAGAK